LLAPFFALKIVNAKMTLLFIVSFEQVADVPPPFPFLGYLVEIFSPINPASAKIKDFKVISHIEYKKQKLITQPHLW